MTKSPSKAVDDIFTPELDSLIADYIAESQDGSREQLRRRIIERCLPYVQRIAKGLARRSSDPVDDLIQVGSMGLMKALDKYNPLAGSSFKTYATYLITGEIRHYLRDKTSVVKPPRQVYELYYRMNLIIQRLSDEMGRMPTDAEIAQELECSVDDVKDVNEVERRRTIVSLDQFVTNENTMGETQYIERLVDERQSESDANHENRMLVDQALDQLKDELQAVVRMTFYEDMSQMEIAKVLGISQMQVSRRLRKALDQLQVLLKREPLDVGL